MARRNDSIHQEQVEFPWNYPTTRRVSRSLRFPEYFFVTESGKQRRVTGTAVRAVLKTIEDHAGVLSWCTVSNPTLAAESSITLSQAKRALAVLDGEGLVVRQTKRTGKVSIRRKLRPNWDQYFESEYCGLADADKEELFRELLDLAGSEVPGSRSEVPGSRSEVPGSRSEVPPEGPRRYRKVDRKEIVKNREDDKRKNRSIGLKMSSEKIDDALQLIGEITSCVSLSSNNPKYSDQQNWEVVAKLAVLTVMGRIPDGWFANAIESCRNKARDEEVGMGYPISIFREKFSKVGCDIGQELKGAFLPKDLRYVGNDSLAGGF